MSESDVRAALPIDTGSTEMVDLTRRPSDSGALEHVAETYASEHPVLPIRIDTGKRIECPGTRDKWPMAIRLDHP